MGKKNVHLIYKSVNNTQPLLESNYQDYIQEVENCNLMIIWFEKMSESHICCIWIFISGSSLFGFVVEG